MLHPDLALARLLRDVLGTFARLAKWDPRVAEFLTQDGAIDARIRTALECTPGCPGWIINCDTAKIERCDDCAMFVNDDDALTAAIADTMRLTEMNVTERAAKAPS